MARALTTKTIEALKPDPERRLEVPDKALTGLYLVMQPSGAKSWALRYRFTGKPKKLTLGRWPIMGLAEARAAAADAIEAVEHGTDPGVTKKETKAARLEAQLSERDKIKTLIEQFDKRHLSSLRSRATVRRELDRHVVSAWGDRNIHDIARRDVIDLLDGIADSGRVVTANRVRSYLNKFLNWTVERDILATSPGTGVKPVAKEASRDRVLSDDEIRWLWQAAETVGQPWGPLAKLLLLTGQRLGEVSAMTDTEVNGDLWQLAPERTKNGRAHDVPLSEAARAILAGMERINGRAGLYHTTNGKTPVSGYHKGRKHLAQQMATAAKRETDEPVEIQHWTFHDLRRTCATGLARLGTPVRVTEAILNHVSGTGGGIVSVYQRHDYAEEKLQALEAWGRHVLALVQSEADNAVQLAER